MNKKILALILALLMALSLIPISAMAATNANSFTVTLEWDEETIRPDHIANYRPDTVTLQLVCNGKNYGDPVDITTTASDSMLSSSNKYTFENLPTVDQNDNPCNYTVEVVDPDTDYHFCITESNHDSATLTATVLYFDFDVELHSDYTGAQFIADAEFTVYSDEECTKAIASAVSSYDYYDYYAYANFAGLTDGTYYVKQTKAAPGYALVDDVFEWILDDNFNYQSNYLEVNTLPAATITLIKEWDDNNNADNTRPDSISVQLLADGENYREPLTLTAKDGWKLTVDDLPALCLTDTGYMTISYSAKEENVAANYTTTAYKYSIEDEKNFSPIFRFMLYNADSSVAPIDANLIIVEDNSNSTSTYIIWTADVLTEAEQQKVLNTLIKDGTPDDAELYTFVSGTEAFDELYLTPFTCYGERYIHILPMSDMRIYGYMYYGFNRSLERKLGEICFGYHDEEAAAPDADIILVGHALDEPVDDGPEICFDVWSEEELPEDFQKTVLEALGVSDYAEYFTFVYGEDAFKELNLVNDDDMIVVQSPDGMDAVVAYMYFEASNNLYAITDITITNTYTDTVAEVAEEEADDNEVVVPNTGDDSDVILYAALLELSIAAAAVILSIRMRRKNNG